MEPTLARRGWWLFLFFFFSPLFPPFRVHLPPARARHPGRRPRQGEGWLFFFFFSFLLLFPSLYFPLGLRVRGGRCDGVFFFFLFPLLSLSPPTLCGPGRRRQKHWEAFFGGRGPAALGPQMGEAARSFFLPFPPPPFSPPFSTAGNGSADEKKETALFYFFFLPFSFSSWGTVGRQ